jgi:hypothetical protein
MRPEADQVELPITGLAGFLCTKIGRGALEELVFRFRQKTHRLCQLTSSAYAAILLMIVLDKLLTIALEYDRHKETQNHSCQSGPA